MNSHLLNIPRWNVILVVLVFIVIASPFFLFCYQTSDFTYLLTSSIFALPIAFLVTFIDNRPVFTIVLSILFICSVIELIMVKGFGSFVFAGNLLAVINTTPRESSSFVRNNPVMLLYLLPVILAFCFSIVIHSKIKINGKLQLYGFAISFLIAFGYITYKQVFFYHGALTSRYYVVKNVLTRPPYNMFLQITNAIRTESRRKCIDELDDFSFGATRTVNPPCKEIYVLGIGESMNYSHTSLNGLYFRKTMPRLEAVNNLTLYSNYYSGACLTMYSVPQIVTRATPIEYELNYKEKSIIQPFKETGFKTYAIVCDNLLGYETYLTAGVDSLFIVNRDIDIPHLVDSLSCHHHKTFFVVEFLGCHSYYYNYEKKFDVFRPNINTDPKANSDSLYINAYDNTVLYADYVMSELIRTIDKPDAASTFTFVSDHGENVTSTGGGHGGDCRPQKTEYHVPFIFWYSSLYSDLFPDKIGNMTEHKDKPVSSDNLFYSLCDMAAIQLPDKYRRADYSIFSSDWSEHARLVLLPDGINTFECE